MYFNFEIKYKLGENNSTNGPLQRLDYTKGFKTGDGKQIIDILLPILQNKLQVQDAQAPIALYIKSQVIQTLLISSNVLASTQSVSNKGPNIPRQDIPDTSLKPSNISPLITKLSP